MNNVATFWNRVRKEQGCWVWRGRRTRFGYGQFEFRGRTWVAHRLAWTLLRGTIPDGLCVCHICDNPPCVNPEHLFVTTYQGNSDDMVRKERQARGFQNGNGRKLACRKDHAYTRTNTRWTREPGRLHRQCRTCDRERRTRTRDRTS